MRDERFSHERKDVLENVRGLCLAFPQAVEVETWGDPTWRVGKRIFVMQKGNADGMRPSLWLKVPKEDQMPLVQSNEGLYFVPPYVGNKGWLGVYLDSADLDWRAMATLIEQSYKLIAPRRLVEQMDCPRLT